MVSTIFISYTYIGSECLIHSHVSGPSSHSRTSTKLTLTSHSPCCLPQKVVNLRNLVRTVLVIFLWDGTFRLWLLTVGQSVWCSFKLQVSSHRVRKAAEQPCNALYPKIPSILPYSQSSMGRQFCAWVTVSVSLSSLQWNLNVSYIVLILHLGTEMSEKLNIMPKPYRRDQGWWDLNGCPGFYNIGISHYVLQIFTLVFWQDTLMVHSRICGT